MKMETAIRLIMRAKGVDQKTLAKMLKLKSGNTIYGRLSNGNITINNAIEMLDIMGFVIVIKEARTGRTRDDEIIITREDEF